MTLTCFYWDKTPFILYLSVFLHIQFPTPPVPPETFNKISFLPLSYLSAPGRLFSPPLPDPVLCKLISPALCHCVTCQLLCILGSRCTVPLCIVVRHKYDPPNRERGQRKLALKVTRSCFISCITKNKCPAEPAATEVTCFIYTQSSGKIPVKNPQQYRWKLRVYHPWPGWINIQYRFAIYRNVQSDPEAYSISYSPPAVLRKRVTLINYPYTC